jgi:cytochrome c5
MAASPTEDAAEVVEVATSGFDAEATYRANCNACHAAGVANAPKLGDKAAWDARMEKGMDAVMVNVMNGINAMPAKGLCMTCSADDLQAIVNYMVAK